MKRTSKGFACPMAKTELLPGLIYIPVHIMVLDFLVPLVMEKVAPAAGPAWSNLVYFSVSLLFILAVMHSWLIKSFSDLIERRMAALTALEYEWSAMLREAKAFVFGSLREHVEIGEGVAAMYPPVEDSLDLVELAELPVRKHSGRKK